MIHFYFIFLYLNWVTSAVDGEGSCASCRQRGAQPSNSTSGKVYKRRRRARDQVVVWRRAPTSQARDRERLKEALVESAVIFLRLYLGRAGLSLSVLGNGYERTGRRPSLTPLPPVFSSPTFRRAVDQFTITKWVPKSTVQRPSWKRRPTPNRLH